MLRQKDNRRAVIRCAAAAGRKLGFRRPRRLHVEKLDERALLATLFTGDGVGAEGHGADLAYADLNNNGIDDLIVMAYDAPEGANHFRYRIGYDVGTDGAPRSWSPIQYGPTVGWEGQGAGLAVTNLDADPRPDLIFMAYDNPVGANSFRYVVGYNVTATGTVSSWSPMRQIEGVGWEGAGAGLAITNLDADPRPDAIFMAYDDPENEPNTFRYRIAYNLDRLGRAQSVSGTVVVDGVGWMAEGAGIAIANLDNDARPDVVLMAYDAPDEANTFRFRVGYNLGLNGRAESWSSQIEVAGLGWKGAGAGLAARDFNSDGAVDFVFMAYDDPAGANEFRFLVHRAEPTAAIVGSELVIDVGVRGGCTVVAPASGNMLKVTTTNLDGSLRTRLFFAGHVASLRIHGSEARDLIFNQTALPSTIHGNGLQDWLSGGTGDDCLYGGHGADTLFGNAGHDSLFGGVGFTDVLCGGSGTDRFLVFGGEEEVRDFARGTDAQIRFENGRQVTDQLFGGWHTYAAGTWSDAEIIQMDAGLGYLHARTGNTRLLRLGTSDGMTYVRQGHRLSGSGDLAGGWNSGNGRQSFTDYGVSDLDVVAVHEIAHNWDGPEDSVFVQLFRLVSDWRDTPAATHTVSGDGQWHWRTSTAETFARLYGRYNPVEDWATTWEAVYARDRGQTTGYTIHPAKTAYVDLFFASLA